MNPRVLRSLLPPLSLAALLIAIFWLQPRTMSYFGLNLLLNLAVPIALATIAQMFILCVNELDLSIGGFVSLVACITATWLHDAAPGGMLALAGLIAGLCRSGRADPSAQPAVHRGHAGHVLRLARPGGADPADPGRQRAALDPVADDAEADASCRSRSLPAWCWRASCTWC